MRDIQYKFKVLVSLILLPNLTLSVFSSYSGKPKITAGFCKIHLTLDSRIATSYYPCSRLIIRPKQKWIDFRHGSDVKFKAVEKGLGRSENTVFLELFSVFRLIQTKQKKKFFTFKNLMYLICKNSNYIHNMPIKSYPSHQYAKYFDVIFVTMLKMIFLAEVNTLSLNLLPSTFTLENPSGLLFTAESCLILFPYLMIGSRMNTYFI